jgi:hypothetical protein
MEMMDCQLCSNSDPAADHEGGDVSVMCWSCKCCGPIAIRSEFDDIPEEEQPDDYVDVPTTWAIMQWNRMQALIAKGSLIDDSAGTKEPKGRL